MSIHAFPEQVEVGPGVPTALGPGAIPAEALRTLLDVAGDGLVLLDEHGRIRWCNSAARAALGGDDARVDLTPLLRDLDPAVPAGGAHRTVWLTPDGRRRHLDHRTVALDDGGAAVWLTDVTETVRQQERITAISRVAASVADTYSLPATLDAVAREFARTAGIAAVQIHAFADPEADFSLLGMAGFGDAADFAARLAACRRRGARMMSIESFTRRERVVYRHRKAAIMEDPSWAPLREIMGRPDWDTFVAVPLIARGQVLGAVNAYYDRGEDPGPAALSFLEAMADHAAVAMDTATLLHHTRSRARSDERRRLARDLHDSAVQQVFSIRLQAEALRSAVDAAEPDVVRLRAAAAELSGLATHALADLRGLLFEMRPLELAHGGVVAAVRASAQGLEARHGVVVEVDAPDWTDEDLDEDLQEDLFRIVQEALHNVVKHAGAVRVHVLFTRTADDGGRVDVEIVDDGRLGSAAGEPGTEGVAGDDRLGLSSMRERAERWGGELDAGPLAGGGWSVRASIPLYIGGTPS